MGIGKASDQWGLKSVFQVTLQWVVNWELSPYSEAGSRRTKTKFSLFWNHRFCLGLDMVVFFHAKKVHCHWFISFKIFLIRYFSRKILDKLSFHFPVELYVLGVDYSPALEKSEWFGIKEPSSAVLLAHSNDQETEMPRNGFVYEGSWATALLPVR